MTLQLYAEATLRKYPKQFGRKLLILFWVEWTIKFSQHCVTVRFRINFITRDRKFWSFNCHKMGFKFTWLILHVYCGLHIFVSMVYVQKELSYNPAPGTDFQNHPVQCFEQKNTYLPLCKQCMRTTYLHNLMQFRKVAYHFSHIISKIVCTWLPVF